MNKNDIKMELRQIVLKLNFRIRDNEVKDLEEYRVINIVIGNIKDLLKIIK